MALENPLSRLTATASRRLGQSTEEKQVSSPAPRSAAARSRSRGTWPRALEKASTETVSCLAASTATMTAPVPVSLRGPELNERM